MLLENMEATAVPPANCTNLRRLKAVIDQLSPGSNNSSRVASSVLADFS
jgi:hypothetical protein